MKNTVEIKRLYDEANTAYTQAKAIMAEFAGKDMPKEKSDELDQLLDKVEELTASAKRLERADGMDAFFSNPDPASQQNFFQQHPEVKVKWNGKELGADEIAELKTLAKFPQFFYTSEEASQLYAKAFRKYLRLGKDMSLPEWAAKALSAGDSQAGGYLVQDTFLNTLLVKSREVSAVRQIANVLPPIASGSVVVPAEDSIFTDAEWTTEIATGSEDTAKPFAQRRLTPHPMAKRVKVSNTLLRTPTFDVEAYVRDRMAYKFAVPEENAFINGNGVGQPQGILNTPGLPTFTTAASNVVTADDIVNWVYTLPAAYAARARILCNRAFVRKVRTLKTGAGEYIWQPGLQMGSPSQILDTPYALSDRYDDGLDASDVWEDNALPATIGAWEYYWIVDALSMSIQRLNELYAEANQVGFIGRKECDGGCVLPEAFLALKIKP